jgi:hypothetical protein
VTASEFAFLALGLVLGVGVGAALSIVLRARPPAPREVRVTVSPDAIPRRPPATLSGLVPPGSTTIVAAARGGPADPGILVGPVDPMRTAVRSGSAPRPAVGIPIQPERDPSIAALDETATAAPGTRRGAAE